jgi:hypothetical protein
MQFSDIHDGTGLGSGKGNKSSLTLKKAEEGPESTLMLSGKHQNIPDNFVTFRGQAGLS